MQEKQSSQTSITWNSIDCVCFSGANFSWITGIGSNNIYLSVKLKWYYEKNFRFFSRFFFLTEIQSLWPKKDKFVNMDQDTLFLWRYSPGKLVKNINFPLFKSPNGTVAPLLFVSAVFLLRLLLIASSYCDFI